MTDLIQKARANRLAALAKATARPRNATVQLVFIRAAGPVR